MVIITELIQCHSGHGLMKGVYVNGHYVDAQLQAVLQVLQIAQVEYHRYTYRRATDNFHVFENSWDLLDRSELKQVESHHYVPAT